MFIAAVLETKQTKQRKIPEENRRLSPGVFLTGGALRLRHPKNPFRPAPARYLLLGQRALVSCDVVTLVNKKAG